jgi:hypothetical protein
MNHFTAAFHDEVRLLASDADYSSLTRLPVNLYRPKDRRKLLKYMRFRFVREATPVSNSGHLLSGLSQELFLSHERWFADRFTEQETAIITAQKKQEHGHHTNLPQPAVSVHPPGAGVRPWPKGQVRQVRQGLPGSRQRRHSAAQERAGQISKKLKS